MVGAKNSEPKLWVDGREGHTRLASILLQYLASAVLKPEHQPKTNHSDGSIPRRGFSKLPITAKTDATDASLLDFACTFFSEHLYHASAEDNVLVHKLGAFLQSHNILSWIEYLAKSSRLTDLALAAMNLRAYYRRRLQYVGTKDQPIRLIDGWATDLVRMTAKFRTQLLTCPSSIHHLIPPLCPSESTISRTFSANKNNIMSSTGARKLVVKGLTSESWDDCLARIDFHQGQPTAMAYGDRHFAIGLSTGQISICDSVSTRQVRQISHPERVKIIQFSPDSTDGFLVSCGTKHLVAWETFSGVIAHSFQLPFPPLAVTFLGTDDLHIICALQSGEMIKW